MAELLKIEMKGSPELIAQFRNAQSTFARQILGRVNRLLAQIASRVTWRLSGNPVHRRTGILAGSVRISPAVHLGDTIYGEVQAGDAPAFYGTILEHGAKPHDIFAVKARALKFMMGNREIYRKAVHHPGFPAYWFMQTTAGEFRARIAKELSESE